jgi:hypothetical protein
MPSKLRVDCRKLVAAIVSIAILLHRLHRKAEVAALIIHGFSLELSTHLLQEQLQSPIDWNGVIREIDNI